MAVARFAKARKRSTGSPGGRRARGRTSPAPLSRSKVEGPPFSAKLIPRGEKELELTLSGRKVKLTNLAKPFWPELGITKGDLLRFYTDIAPWLLPHLKGRAMVMKRYPNGAGGDFFFQKRAPTPRPEWLQTCAIQHSVAGLVDFPVVDDLAALLWVVNLGCIDLNPWYARCGDVTRPDYLHFDLDPTPGATIGALRECALRVHEALEKIGAPNLVKTSGSRGLHVYVPIKRGPTQKEVWTIAKRIAQLLGGLYPKLITTEYKVANRPPGHVLVDYNQNAFGRTLASVYSVRPKPKAPVSTPVTWKEVEQGLHIEDFRIDNVLDRVRKLGDLWQPLLEPNGRFDLSRIR